MFHLLRRQHWSHETLWSRFLQRVSAEVKSYERELCDVQKIDEEINSSFCLILRKTEKIADLCTISWRATDTFNVVVLTVLRSSSFQTSVSMQTNCTELCEWNTYTIIRSRFYDCQSRTFTQFSEFLLLIWFSTLALHVLSQFAVKKSCEQVFHVVMFSRTRLFILDTIFLIIESLDILHHSCWARYDAAIIVLSALFDREFRWLNQIQKRSFLIWFLFHESMHSSQWSQNEDSARTQTDITQMNNDSLIVCLPDLYFSNLYLKRAMKLWMLFCTNISDYILTVVMFLFSSFHLTFLESKQDCAETSVFNLESSFKTASIQYSDVLKHKETKSVRSTSIIRAFISFNVLKCLFKRCEFIDEICHLTL